MTTNSISATTTNTSAGTTTATDPNGLEHKHAISNMAEMYTTAIATDQVQHGDQRLSRHPSTSSLGSSSVLSESSSAASSAEDENGESYSQPQAKSFPFFRLPYELRSQILSYIVCAPHTIDIDYTCRSSSAGHARAVYTLLSMLHVSRRFNDETAAAFFGRNTFRLFPTHAIAASRLRAQPVIRRFSARYRRLITRVEMRLGPFWTQPPPCWKVDIRLGLKDLIKVRRVDVFVECDPSQAMFAGFRKSETFYTVFAARLFEAVLKRMPAVKGVCFDGYRSVAATGPLVQALVDVAQRKGKEVAWGGGLGLEQLNKDIELELGLISSGLDTLNLQLLAPHA